MISETTHLKELLPLLQPYAPRVAPIVAVYHLREAAIKWCKGTRCWRETITQPVLATEGTNRNPRLQHHMQARNRKSHK